jgi:predicted kinase
MPICYQLVGVPGSGKTTWIKNQPWAKDCVIVSSDDHIETYAKTRGKTYSEVFNDIINTATKLMLDDARNARKQGKDVIWDQTSTTVNSRKRKFETLPDYTHIAVVFDTPPMNVLNQRLNSRVGKNIPVSVLDSMIKNFQMPTESEGFSEIWRV